MLQAVDLKSSIFIYLVFLIKVKFRVILAVKIKSARNTDKPKFCANYNDKYQTAQLQL